MFDDGQRRLARPSSDRWFEHLFKLALILDLRRLATSGQALVGLFDVDITGVPMAVP